MRRPRHLGERPARVRRHGERIGEAEREPLRAGPGDHGAVVGAQFRRRRHQHGAGLERHLLQHLADRLVGGDAAGGDQRGRLAVLPAEDLQAGAQPVGDHLDHALLERGAEVAHVGVAQRRAPLRLEPHRGLESGQGEVGVRPPEHRPRQAHARGSPSSACFSTSGPPG